MRNVSIYLFIAPAVLILAFVTAYPVVAVCNYSLYSFNLLSKNSAFVGFGEYVKTLKDDVFSFSVRDTVAFTLLATFSELLLGLLTALILNQKLRGKSILVPLAVLPNMFPAVAVAAMWKLLLDYQGVVNYFLNVFGIPRQLWLASAALALPSIALMDLWSWSPVCFLVIYAGLQSIPRELYEAARLDGAGALVTFRRITVPFLGPYFMLALLLRSIDSFRLFDKVYLLTAGGPGHATETLTLYIFRVGLVYLDIGQASAASFLTLLIVLLLSIAYVRQVLRR